MPFGLGGGPWWLYNLRDYTSVTAKYNQGYRGWQPYSRCFRFLWLPRWWWASGDYPTYQPTKGGELDTLKEEAKALNEELKAIKERIEQLEEKKV